MSLTSLTSFVEARVAALMNASDARAQSPYRLGLEKEALRVAPDGGIAMTPHPAALGSALTHPYITTDFSEALTELVTPAVASIDAVLAFLFDLHAFVYRHIGEERLWATSMPCILDSDREIPLARYGRSHAGRMKTVYRRGLGHRYGRAMQAIAGIHLNLSLREEPWESLQRHAGQAGDPRAFRDEQYMGMVRNLQRFGWIVPYLFGASPAVCKSFVRGTATDLQSFDDNSFYYPHATSLRMGDIGYQNRQEEGTGMKACYDSLDAYIRSLTWAIQTPCPLYEKIGVKVGGRYEQLNDHVLQIENEYYSTVRPKQITEWMERPTLALRRRGIRYVELRSIDVNAFHPLGSDAEQLHFLVTLMLYSLLLESPRIDARERRAIDANEVLAAHRGRAPGLELERKDGAIGLRAWTQAVLDGMIPVAEWLDGGATGPHGASINAQRAKADDPDATPSARMLAEMRASGESFAAFARRLSERHGETFRRHALEARREAEFNRAGEASWQRQARIEASDTIDFDEFLARYFAQSERHPVELPNP